MYQNSYLYRMGTVCSTRTRTRAHTRIRIRIHTRTRHPKSVFMLKIGKKYFSIILRKFNTNLKKYLFVAFFAQFSHLSDEYNIF